MASVRSPGPPVVLLLEDEPILQMVLVDFIEEAGCVALETNSTAEAISLLETRPDIRIVFADLDVRGSVMGMKLASLIRDRWPPVELVLTGALKPEADTLPLRGEFYGKPFDHRRIVASLRRFVGG